MDGIGSSPTPTKSEGAFHTPEPVKVSTPAGVQTVKPTTDHVTINPGTGAVATADKPLEIPKTAQWQQPMTVVQTKQKYPEGSTFKAVATFSTDGDTQQVTDKAGAVVNCRIAAIDAPETAHPNANPPKPGQPYGDWARDKLRSMIERKEVTVKVSYGTTGQGTYNRTLCQIEIEGKDVSKELVRAGAAMVYERYAKDPELFTLQKEARAAHRGLWADPNPINPEQFRHYGK